MGNQGSAENDYHHSIKTSLVILHEMSSLYLGILILELSSLLALYVANGEGEKSILVPVLY